MTFYKCNLLIKGLFFLSTFIFFVSQAQANQVKQLNGSNVLVLYKNNDPLSKNIASYYAKKRHVPLKQIVGVPLGKQGKISPEKFEQIRDGISKHLTKNIKIILMTWDSPYQVGCMSITSAFTLGYEQKYCSNTPEHNGNCRRTASSPYFNKSSAILWQRDDLRLSMMLSARTIKQAKSLIDRGVQSDYTKPHGDAYLVRTYDRHRSARWLNFKEFAQSWPKLKDINIYYIDDSKSSVSTKVKNKSNIMFYFTGLAHVPDIETNNYLPGSIADHLTSFGGRGIDEVGQMKVYRWLEQGVTGSYGTVVEPCNFTEKFPNPRVLIPNYLKGDTLIEAYWKSVEQPGEGIFVGEPLASPWKK